MRVRKERRDGRVPEMRQNPKLIAAFASELKYRRGLARISQDELARRAEINRTFIAKLELAQSQPTLTVLDDIARALNRDLPGLIAGVFSRYKENQLKEFGVVIPKEYVAQEEKTS